MKQREKKNRIISILGLGLVLLTGFLLLTACGGRPVDVNGRLQVIGTQLCNAKGDPVQLKGMSFMDVAWFGDFANTSAFTWLRDQWDCSLIRAALYTVGDGRFRAMDEIDKMETAVDTAIETGLYVLIDWHILYDGNPQKYKEQALSFFKQMAERYKDSPNVLYEICNEPNGDDVTWEGAIRPYAVEVITAIRKIDPDNIIIVGTPHWCQYVDLAAQNPLPYKNIMYTCHFYAGSHGSAERDRIRNALDKKLPVFITEWGTTEAEQTTGTGVFPVETYAWLDFINKKGLSWANWSITTRKEPSAAMRYYASPEGHWADSDLTESGLLVRAIMRGQEKDMVLFADSFESANFIPGGWSTNNVGIDRNSATQGEISAVLKNHGSLTRAFATQPFKNIRIRFSYKTKDMGADDSFRIEWFDGSSWTTLKNLSPSGGWTKTTVSFPEQANDNAQFQFRLVNDSKNSDAAVNLDEISLIMDRKK
jgi:endoglucanase